MDRREYKRQYVLAHREQIRRYAREYYKKYSKEHPERLREWIKKSRAKARYETIHHYSNGKMCCECCGEKAYEFLCIDHIGGGGGRHRQASSSTIGVWLRQRGFPKGYRVLCHNCNMSLGFYGYCPHQLK